ncbi:rab GTPase-activating protein 22 isoform X2 [Malania oleifera]|uniref:rab GTPase-activating protein 22 isoform X2 n=1 Tax=Malania oleifera TaxID=397392 RepID=UPI0025AEBC6A|nr:rab GTPase-activating protein 22 isoform X2 [Malania oleifera]
MLTEQKHLMRALRRSNTSSPSSSNSSSPSSSWIHLRSVLLVVASSSPVSTDRGSLKSPWSRRRRKHALLPKQWKSLFKPDGKISDGGIKFLKKVRSGGVDPSIRAEVWPFLLGVYDVNSSKEERNSIKAQKRKEYENLRGQCWQILKCSDESCKSKEISGNSSNEGSGNFSEVLESAGLEDITRKSFSAEGGSQVAENLDQPVHTPVLEPSSDSLFEVDGDKSGIALEDVSPGDTESSDSDSSDEYEDIRFLFSTEGDEQNNIDEHADESSSSPKTVTRSKSHTPEDFATWQRIIRLDAVRTNAEWIVYSPSQAAVSETEAQRLAESVGLKDYDHLEPCRIFHAARLVAILEAYALYDSEIGYCQGMSDLLSPIISVIEDDQEAFWCFVGFMRKARHNFRLDEVGIRRQLSIVSKIIKCKDSHLYKHLEKLQAEDCFFVYRMVVVLFRRELNFEQTLCLWEVMWADQAAIRAGIGKSDWGRMRLRAPPTEDLLLYAIAACVLQRRKLIIEKYCSMDEIMRECNSMAGHLDVWKLLDDAHDLVVNLHDKMLEKPS